MIHKYKMHGKYIVLDVNSGAVHELDKLAYDLLDHFGEEEKKIIDNFSGKYGREETAETLSELKELKDNGLLFSEDTYEDYLTELSAAKAEKPVVKALCLHIAHDCNLRCRYCFASTGDFGTKRALMSAETGKKAIDFVIEKSGSRRNIEIDFFGGEPLLNFAVVEQIVDYALKRGGETGKNFRFTITTNATLLKEEYKEFINKYMGNVVLSIDGRPEVNDGMRVRADGRGTYDEILPKIKDMADSRNQENYYVRGTYTRKNTDFSEDVLHLADLGFRQISVEPVVAAKGTGFDLRREDLPKLFEEYEKLALEYVNRHKSGKGFNFFHFMLDLDHGPCPVKRMKGCGSGDEYLAVTPEGDLYPCHQFVGMEGLRFAGRETETFHEYLRRHTEVSDVLFTGGAQMENDFFNWLEQHPDLARYAGQVVPANSGRAKWVNNFDLRISQQLPSFFEGHKAEFNFDIMNVGNLLNKKWGLIEDYGFYQTMRVANYAGIDPATGKYVYTFSGSTDEPGIQENNNDKGNTGVSRWSVMATFKYSF